MLTPAQLASFAENGYILLTGAFAAHEVRRLAEEADRVLEACINLSLASGVSSPVLTTSLGRAGRPHLSILRIDNMHVLSSYTKDIARDLRVQQPLMQLMQNSNPLLIYQEMLYKQTVLCPEFIDCFRPGLGNTHFPVHYDGRMYELAGYPATTRVAIFVDDALAELGPFRVIPGSHVREWPLKDAASPFGTIADGIFTDSDFVEINSTAGTIMVFDSMLLHDSLPNRTVLPRRVLYTTFCPAHGAPPESEKSKKDRLALLATFMLYRAKVKRGQWARTFTLSPAYRPPKRAKRIPTRVD